MTTDAEEFGARVILTAETIEPICSAPHNCRANRDSLNIRYRRRAPGVVDMTTDAEEFGA